MGTPLWGAARERGREGLWLGGDARWGEACSHLLGWDPRPHLCARARAGSRCRTAEGETRSSALDRRGDRYGGGRYGGGRCERRSRARHLARGNAVSARSPRVVWIVILSF